MSRPGYRLFVHCIGDTIGVRSMRSALATRLSLLLAILFVVPVSLFAQNDTSIAPLPVFEFHSGFWLNLHHTLYRQARQHQIYPIRGCC